MDHRDRKALLVLQGARDKHLRIATAESCTGGLLASILTAEGVVSSGIADRGRRPLINQQQQRLDVIELTDVLKAIWTDPLEFLEAEARSPRPKRDRT